MKKKRKEKKKKKRSIRCIYVSYVFFFSFGQLFLYHVIMFLALIFTDMFEALLAVVLEIDLVYLLMRGLAGRDSSKFRVKILLILLCSTIICVF